MQEIYSEAIPWIIWTLGFMIVYMVASAADDARQEIEE